MAEEDEEESEIKEPKEMSDEDLQKEVEERQAELEKRLQAKKEKENEERQQRELLEVIKLETQKLEEERLKLVEERIKFEEILNEIREEGSSAASSRPRSLVLQRVSSDEESGHVRRKSNVGFIKFIKSLICKHCFTMATKISNYLR